MCAQLQRGTDRLYGHRRYAGVMLLMWGVKEKVLEGDDEGRRLPGHSIAGIHHGVRRRDSCAQSGLDWLMSIRAGFSAGAMFVRTANATSSAFWAEVASTAQINEQVSVRMSQSITDFAHALNGPVFTDAGPPCCPADQRLGE